MIINKYLHIAAPATIAHTYLLLPYPLLDTIHSLYRLYHIIVIIIIIIIIIIAIITINNIIYILKLINTSLLPRLIMMIMPIHCSLIAPSMINSFQKRVLTTTFPSLIFHADSSLLSIISNAEPLDALHTVRTLVLIDGDQLFQVQYSIVDTVLGRL